LNDLIQFRAEIDVNENYLETEFHLDFDLYFSDMSNLGGAENWKEHAKDLEDKAVFKLMQS
jgi:hypothetical protein